MATQAQLDALAKARATSAANRRGGHEGEALRLKAMTEAKEQQAQAPAEGLSGAVLLMKQTRQEVSHARAAAEAVPEVDEILMVNDPVEQTQLLDQGRGVDEQFTSVASRVTSPEATQSRKNYVNVTRPPMRTLYRDNGDGVEVFHSDVATLVEEGHMHVRCPKCRYLKPDHARAHLWAVDKYGNRVPGIHATIGENTCPGTEELMWLPCRIPGCGKRVYEDPPVAALANAATEDREHMFELGPKDHASNEDRRVRCEFKRGIHEVSFHEQSALQLLNEKWETYRGRRLTAA